MDLFYYCAHRFIICICLFCVLVCLPSTAHATWPVIDVQLNPMFLSYYTYLMTKQWPTENYQRSYNTTTLLATSEANQFANTAGQQSNIDMMSRMAQAAAAAGMAQDHVFLPQDEQTGTGNSWCPIIKTLDALDESAAALNALETAMNDLFHDLGTSSANPLSAAKLFSKLCEIGLLPLETAKDLFKGACQISDKKYQNALLYPITVVGPLEYRFPGNIRKLPNGVLAIEKPDKADMEGLAAVMYCASVHPPTPRSSASDTTRKVTVTDVYNHMLKLRAQQAQNLSSSGCLSSLVPRLAIPSDAPTAELARAHDAQEKYCLYMHKTKCMSDKDYADCKKNGISFIKEGHRLACQMKMPRCAVQGLVGRGFKAETATTSLMNGRDRCDAFWKSVQKERLDFATGIRGMIGGSPGATTDPDSTARPSE